VPFGILHSLPLAIISVRLSSAWFLHVRMNCPSRNDEPPDDHGWNQSPPIFSADLTTRQDLNGMVNLRATRTSGSSSTTRKDQAGDAVDGRHAKDRPPRLPLAFGSNGKTAPTPSERARSPRQSTPSMPSPYPTQVPRSRALLTAQHVRRTIAKFGTFIGPGFMIAVAYIDPGNYSTDVAAGAATRFKLLFIILMSNVFAILLQSLAVRLGTVTGLNLAEHCRAHLPRWLNLFLYFLGEAAIIATDIAEVDFFLSKSAIRLMLTLPIGHWLSHSAQSASQDPPCCWLRSNHG